MMKPKVIEYFRLKFDMDILDKIKQNANKLELSENDYLNLIINEYMEKI